MDKQCYCSALADKDATCEVCVDALRTRVRELERLGSTPIRMLRYDHSRYCKALEEIASLKVSTSPCVTSATRIATEALKEGGE